MKRALLMALIALGPSILASASDSYQLVRISATGSTRFSSEDVALAAGLSLKSQVTEDDLQKGAQRLANNGSFSNVQYSFRRAIGTTKGIEAEFKVTDSDKFLPVSFENFVWFSDNELHEMLRHAVPLYRGLLPSAGSMADDVSDALSKFLASKSLPSKVSYLLAAEAGTLISSYRFRVDAELKIADVHVSGAGGLTPELVSGALSQLKGRSYFRNEVEATLQRSLVELYRRYGFLKMTLQQEKPEVSQDTAITVNVSVDEGQRYKLGAISWSGNTLISGDDLSRNISLKPGDVVNFIQLQTELDRIRRQFAKLGRQNARITSVPSFEGDKVLYNFKITEGELYHMGSLEVEGLDPGPADKVTQSWKLAQGAPYDGAYIQQFITHTAVKVPGHRTVWVVYEQIDDQRKAVNVVLKLKIE